MGGLSDFLFGEEPEVEKDFGVPTRTPEQMALLAQLAKMFQSSPDLQQGTTPFGGKMAPDLSTLERTSLAALEERAMAMGKGAEDPVMQKARSTATDLMDSRTDLGEFNSYFKGAIEDPMLKAFQEQIMPQLTARYAHSAFGSDRMVAEGRAASDLTSNLGATRADLLFKTNEANKNRRLQAAGLAPNLIGQETQELMKLLSAGGVPRQAEDNRLTREYAEFVRQQESKQRSMQMALALLGISPVENIAVAKEGTEGFLTSLAKGGAFNPPSLFGGK